MSHPRPTSRNLPSHLLSYRTIRLQRRTYAIEPQTQPRNSPPGIPTPQQSASKPSKPPSRVGAFYKTFSYPILKCFLGALFTYQLAYFVWLKLEVVEEQIIKESEVQGLKNDLRNAVLAQKEGTREAVQEVETKTRSVREEVKKNGWWPW